MKKIALFILGVAILTSLFFFRRSNDVSRGEPEASALGLRGSSPITRPLTFFQRRKLEKHFLDSPPMAHTPVHPSQSSALNVLNEINTINKLNRRQREQK